MTVTSSSVESSFSSFSSVMTSPPLSTSLLTSSSSSIWMESMLSSVVSTTPTPSPTLLPDTSSSTEDDSLSPSLSPLSSSSFTFNCLSFNARSLVNKLADRKCLLDKESPDGVFVSETWLHSSLPHHLLCSSDYNLYRRDRKTRGGGVCTFIKASFFIFNRSAS